MKIYEEYIQCVTNSILYTLVLHVCLSIEVLNIMFTYYITPAQEEGV